MATKYQYYDTGGDTYWGIYAARYVAQLFTPSTAHKITSVKIYAKKAGSPGTVTVEIQGVSGGHPDGTAICLGTIEGSGLSTTPAWVEITLGAGATLAAGTQYAILVKLAGGDVSNRIEWQEDSAGATYAGGNWEYSTDSGSNWTSLAAADGMFEEWGLPLELAVTIQAMTDIRPPTAKAHGTIVTLGLTSCTQHGHCWSTSANPTTADSKTELGAGSEGAFVSTLTDLLKATTYHVRAYAIDSAGTVYSSDISFIRYGPWNDEADLPFTPTGGGFLFLSPIVDNVIYIIDAGANFCKYDLGTRTFTVLNSPTYDISNGLYRNLVISPDGLKMACISEVLTNYRGGRRIEIYTIAGNSWGASSQVQDMEGSPTVVNGLVWADNNTIWAWASKGWTGAKTYARCIKYTLSTDTFDIYSTLLSGLTYCEPANAGINAAGTIIYGSRIGATTQEWFKYTIATDSYASGGTLTAGRAFAMAAELGGDKLWYITTADYRQGYLRISDESEHDNHFFENPDRTDTYGIRFGVTGDLQGIIAHARVSDASSGTELMSINVHGTSQAIIIP